MIFHILYIYIYCNRYISISYEYCSKTRSFGGPNSIPPVTPTAPAAIFVLVLRKALQGLMKLHEGVPKNKNWKPATSDPLLWKFLSLSGNQEYTFQRFSPENNSANLIPVEERFFFCESIWSISPLDEI